MRSAELVLGRRWVVVLEPGEEVLTALRDWAADVGVVSATVDMFYGAFRGVRLIASDGPVADPEPPLPDEVGIAYVEGVGAGSLTTVDGVPRPHLHLSAGVKDQGGVAYAGHVLSAEAHYTVELVVQEVLAPTFSLRPDPRAHGLAALRFDS